MVEAPRSLLDSLAIRLLGSDGKHLGMATLISPTVALTSVRLVANPQQYFLSRFALSEAPRITATVIARDSRVGFAALILGSPMVESLPDFTLNSSVPQLESLWESLYYSEDKLQRLSGKVISTELTDDHPRIQLSIAQISGTFFVPYMLGAPVIVDEDWLVGVLSEGQSESQPDDCAAIPFGAILNSPEWKQVTEAMLSDAHSTRPLRDDDPVDEQTPDLASEEAPSSNATEKRRPTKRPSPAKFDPITFQKRLSSSSLTALTHANGILRAQGQDKMHMEHLIAGLLQKSNGPTRTEFARAGIDRNKLAEIIAREVHTTLPAENAYPLQGGPALSLLSKHVEQAFRAAVSLADANKSEAIRTRHLIRGALSIADCTLIKALISEGVEPERIPLDDGPPPPRRRTQAGIKSDDPEGEDLLDIKAEVEALCAVLASKEVKPPISLGLFGDWGSGKSFFMKKMEARFNELKDVARKGDSAFCSNIVQLWFNAWHYMDTNLWASLATEIFDELAQELARQDALAGGITDPDYERAQLVARRATATEEVVRAEQAKVDADTKVRASEQQLASIQSGDTAVSMSPQEILRAGYRFAVQQPEVRQQVKDAESKLNQKVEEAARTLNIERPVDSVKEQLLELKGIWGYAQSISLAVRDTKNKWRWLLSLGVILGILASFYWLLPLFIGQEYIQSVWLRISRVVLIALGALAPFLPAGHRAVQIIHDAIKANQESIEKARLEAETKLQQEHQQLQQDAAVAQKSLEEKTAAAVALTERLDNLRSDRQISNFIRQRQQSSDYTRYLGVIAKARNDFEQLSALLAKEQERSAKERDEQRKRNLQGPQPGAGNASETTDNRLLPRIDRIILYIDDLDRCPEHKVVDVLQAVHLLLAFPLFIVVVGVDPRWLLHALRKHSKAFRNQLEAENASEEERIRWQSTPLNYLEKIFQIPFTLWPMGKSGFGKMVDTLTEPPKPPKKEEEPVGSMVIETEPSEVAQTKPEAKQPPADSAIEIQAPIEKEALVPVNKAGWWKRLATSLRQWLRPGRTSEAKQTLDEAVAGANKEVTEASKPEEPATEPGNREQGQTAGKIIIEPAAVTIDPNPEHLQIKSWERDFMKELHQLISSPRATKRFINIYRLIRAAVDIDEKLDLDEFIGNETQGKYRATLLLLAILTGYPDQAAEILRELVEKKHTETWWQFIDSFKVRAEIRQIPLNGKVATVGGRPAKSRAVATKGAASKAAVTKTREAQNAHVDNDLGDVNAQAWQQLFERLNNLRHVIPPRQSCADFVEWAPKVARYSFQSGRVLLTRSANGGNSS